MKNNKTIQVIHASDADQHLGHLKKILDSLKQEERIADYTCIEGKTVNANSFNALSNKDMVIVLLTTNIVENKAAIENLLLEFKGQMPGIKIAEILLDNVSYETNFIAFPTSLEPIRASEDMDKVWEGIAHNLKKLFPAPIIEPKPDPILPSPTSREKTWWKKNKRKVLYGIGFLFLAGLTYVYWGMEKPDGEIYEESTITPFTLDTQGPQSDFSDGSTKVYSALFNKWPVKETEQGIAKAVNGRYLLKPLSNTWFGPGNWQDISPLQQDFVMDLNFRIKERNPSSALYFSLRGTGKDADYVQALLSVWSSEKATYSLNKGHIKDNFYQISEKHIAERELVPEEIRGYDWTRGGTLTLKRQGGMMQFFLNGTFVKEFRMSKFSVTQISLAAAFDSTINISSIEARVP